MGLRAGRVRLAGFQTVLSTLVPRAAAELSRLHPGIEVNLVDAHPVEGLQMLRAGHVDIALIFRHAGTPLEEEGIRLTHLLDDPLYLVRRDRQLRQGGRAGRSAPEPHPGRWRDGRGEPAADRAPCHRVVGADGGLTGYAGGVERKRELLTREGALQPQLI